MNNHKSVQVVMLPTHKSALAIKDSNNKLEIAEQNASFINGIGYTPQHLYFISTDTNEEIKEGDIAVYNGELYHINTHHKGITYKGKNATSGGGRTEYNYYTVLNMSKRTSSTEIIHYPYSRRFKPVVVCSDPSLGLPAIPLTWIRDVYVPSNGSINKVTIETERLETLLPHRPTQGNGWYMLINEPGVVWERIKVTPDNEVVIVDEPKPFTKEEFVYQLKHVVPIDQRGTWAKENWPKVVHPNKSVDQELEDAVKAEYLKMFPYPTSNDSKQVLECLSKQSGFKQGAVFGANWKAEQLAKEIESRTEVIKEYQKAIDQSANDAMSFVEWVHKQHYEIPNSNIPITWTNEGHRWPPNNIYTTQELYELWQQTRNK